MDPAMRLYDEIRAPGSPIRPTLVTVNLLLRLCALIGDADLAVRVSDAFGVAEEVAGDACGACNWTPVPARPERRRAGTRPCRWSPSTCPP